MTEPDDDAIYYGGAQPGDVHLAAIVHCVDGEIVAWLKGRERRFKTKKADADAARAD
jgi:hypothetical protein